VGFNILGLSQSRGIAKGGLEVELPPVKGKIIGTAYGDATPFATLILGQFGPQNLIGEKFLATPLFKSNFDNISNV
jgi:hypothetical protein